jgi:hypothetical protein
MATVAAGAAGDAPAARIARKHAAIGIFFSTLALNTMKDYRETHMDGSNTFIYPRYLTPHLFDFKGRAIFV